MQGGLGDFQAPDHAAGVFTYQTVGVGSQPHELQGLADAGLLLATRQIVELGKDEQVLVPGEGSVDRHRLWYIADRASDVDCLGGDRVPSHMCLAR